jgi:hypothetical protein
VRSRTSDSEVTRRTSCAGLCIGKPRMTMDNVAEEYPLQTYILIAMAPETIVTRSVTRSRIKSRLRVIFRF